MDYFQTYQEKRPFIRSTSTKGLRTDVLGAGITRQLSPPLPRTAGERFFQEFTLGQVLLNAAKNASGPSAAGTSSPAGGPSIAKPAEKTTCRVPEAIPAPMDGSAPTASTP
jgi:hypothetical protein